MLQNNLECAMCLSLVLSIAEAAIPLLVGIHRFVLRYLSLE